MSLATLLVYPSDPKEQNWFSFDHQQEHSNLVAQMTTPNIYNLANYLLDPTPTPNMGATNWMFAHQIAHDDAADWYHVQPSLILIDQDPGSSPWWTFANFSEHMSLSQAAFLSSLG